MLVLTHNTHYTMPIVSVRPISLCSIRVSPVEFVNSWYLGIILQTLSAFHYNAFCLNGKCNSPPDKIIFILLSGHAGLTTSH